MLLKKDSQGLSKKLMKSYEQNPLDRNPLLSKKRKWNDISTSAPLTQNPIQKTNVTFADFESRTKLQQQANEEFGDFELPSLEKLKWTLEGTFEVDSFQTQSSVTCNISFLGPNVLEGIKSLVSHGLIQLPLPPHLKDLPSKSANHFRVKTSEDTSENNEESVCFI